MIVLYYIQGTLIYQQVPIANLYPMSTHVILCYSALQFVGLEIHSNITYGVQKNKQISISHTRTD